MQTKLQQYLTTLETLRDNANEQEQEAISFAVEKVQQELQKYSLEMFSS